MSSFKEFPSGQNAPAKDVAGGKPKQAPAPAKPSTEPNNAPAKDMARYGITRVPVDYYHYGAFRYSSLKDAVAQAKRSPRL